MKWCSYNSFGMEYWERFSSPDSSPAVTWFIHCTLFEIGICFVWSLGAIYTYINVYIYIYIYIAIIVSVDRVFCRTPGGGQKVEDSGSAERLARSVCKNDFCKSDSRVVFVPNRGGWRCSGRVGCAINVDGKPNTM